MSIQVRTIIIVSSLLLLAIYFGYQVGSGNLFFAVFTASALGFFVLLRFTRVLPDTLVLTLLIFGYIVGNRGFAQITLLGNLPLFLGELSLLFLIAVLVVEIAIKKSLPFRLDKLSCALLLWMLFASIRLLFDIREFGITALRDFATVYYCSFFPGP